MPAAGPSRRQSPEFKPSQLVLCRYERYPYWPAKINNNLPSEVKEGYRCKLDTHEGTFTFYWCMFCNEEKGGWVREDRIVLYHPSLVRYARVSADNSWYQEQEKSFRAALKFYNALHSKALAPKPSDPIPDLLEIYRRGGDLHESDDDVSPRFSVVGKSNIETISDETVTDPKDEASPVIEESSVLGSDQRAAKKRSIQLETHESELQKAPQKQRLDTLQGVPSRPTLENLNDGAEVTFFAPPPPEEYPVVLPDKSTYNSEPTNTASFSAMMDDLRERIARYSESSKDAEEAHQIFDIEKENIRRKYKDLFEKLRQIERRAADDKKSLVTLLQDILQARVDIADLRKHRAGTLVKTLGTDSEDVPAVHTLCEEIAKVWAAAVDAYVDQYRQNL